MFLILNLIFVFLIKVNVGEKIYAADEGRDKLLKDILNNYNPSARPAGSNETVMLSVNIDIQHFDFQAKTGAFHLVGLLEVKWHDPKLVWSAPSYGNMSHILISTKSIWIPDLEFYTNIPNKSIQMYRNGFVSVKNDGVVFWSDSIEINVFCSANLEDWPHDKHDCVIILGSWTFDGLEVNFINLNMNSTMIFSSIDRQNMEYKITKFNATHDTIHYSCCPEPYVSLNYNITFERESSYVVIFRIPALTIILFTLFALRLEPHRTEKLWLNGLSYILISFQLIYFAKSIEHFHGTPNIVIFFSTCLVVVTISQLLAIFSLFVTHSKFKGHLPLIIETALNSSFIWYLVRTEHISNECEVDEQFEQIKLEDTSSLIGRNLSKFYWLKLAKVFNILAFLSFSFLFLILGAVCFV